MSTATLAPEADPSNGPAYRSSPRATSADEGPTVVEVTVAWGDEVLVRAHLTEGERFELRSCGRTDPSAHAFVHPAMTSGAHVLVAHERARCVVTPPGDGAAPFDLPRATVASIDHGDVRYTLRHVPAAPPLPPRRGDRLLGVATALAATFSLAIAVQARASVHAEAAREGRTMIRLTNWLSTHPHLSRVFVPTHPEPTGGDEGGTGLRASGDEGAAGLRAAPRASRAWRRPPGNGFAAIVLDAAGTTGERDAVWARGVFAALGPAGARSWSELAPGETVSTSGAMYGAAEGDARGYAGLGLLGAGLGGGSTGAGLIGLGRMRTRGHGTDDGRGQGMGGGGACGCGEGIGDVGHGVGRLGVRAVGAPAVSCGSGCAPSVTSALSAAAIRRVVLRNLGQVRHCYEGALATVPGAAGRVGVRWVVGEGGAVIASAVTSNDTGAAELGECIASAVRRWSFPVGEGGGVVTVNYPFDLSLTEP